MFLGLPARTAFTKFEIQLSTIFFGGARSSAASGETKLITGASSELTVFVAIQYEIHHLLDRRHTRGIAQFRVLGNVVTLEMKEQAENGVQKRRKFDHCDVQIPTVRHNRPLGQTLPPSLERSRMGVNEYESVQMFIFITTDQS